MSNRIPKISSCLGWSSCLSLVLVSSFPGWSSVLWQGFSSCAGEVGRRVVDVLSRGRGAPVVVVHAEFDQERDERGGLKGERGEEGGEGEGGCVSGV